MKRFNISSDLLTFNTPFALYIQPYENSYLNFILNSEENYNIIKEASNKFIQEKKEYTLKAPSKLMAVIEEEFDTKINVYKEGKIISTLSKDNPSLQIDEPDKDLIFIGEKNAVVNLYYNITDIYFEESINIISFDPEKKGEIMIVTIISVESKPYFYAINYGYNGYISPDTKKIKTTQTYFFIEDPYLRMKKNERLKHYLILFGKNIKYEINYIKKYEKEKNTFYYKILPKDNFAIDSELNFPKGYYTYELLLCANDNVNITMVDIYNRTKLISNEKIMIDKSDIKAIFTFVSQSEFIFSKKKIMEMHFLIQKLNFIYRK